MSGKTKTLSFSEGASVSAPSQSLQQSAIDTKTAAYTILTSDDILIGDSSSGTFNFTLPTAVGNTGKIYEITKSDISSEPINVVAAGGEFISGYGTHVLQGFKSSVRISSDGTNWHSISNSQNNYVISDADGVTITDKDDIDSILITSTSSDNTVLLPNASTNKGRIITAKNISTDKGIVYFAGLGTNVIEGKYPKLKLDFRNAAATLQSDGSQWLILSETITSEQTIYQTTITSTNWTTAAVDIRPSRDIAGNWFADYDFVGAWSAGSSSSASLIVSDMTSKANSGDENRAVSLYDHVLQNRAADQGSNAYWLQSSTQISLIFQSSIDFGNRWGFTGRLPLLQKPKFVE